MPKSLPYREQEKIENTQRLRELLKELPPYVRDFSELRNNPLLINPDYPMHMICEYFFVFY